MSDAPTHVVVIFGHKRKHSDVLGPYPVREAENLAEMLHERDGFETHAFPLQTLAQYNQWLRGE